MKLQYMLDTNICIYIAKQQPASVLNKFQQLAVGRVGMSTITYGELKYGAAKSNNAAKANGIIDELANLIPPLPLPTDAADYYGKVRGRLEKAGNIIGNNDLWIAAHALAMKLILITNNVKEFSKVHGLRTENWVN